MDETLNMQVSKLGLNIQKKCILGADYESHIWPFVTIPFQGNYYKNYRERVSYIREIPY